MAALNLKFFYVSIQRIPIMFYYYLGTLDHPTRGYSSFKFLPGSDDQIVVALKSEEVNDRYQSFITAFTIDGEVLLDDLQVSEKYKFEGLEFV